MADQNDSESSTHSAEAAPCDLGVIDETPRLEQIRTKEQAQREAAKILATDYPCAKYAILELEVYRRTKSEKAVFELRDFLDHIHYAFLDDCPVEEVVQHLIDAKHHLRRCVVEPMEYFAEDQIVKIDKILDEHDGHWVYKIGLIRAPKMPTEFHEKRAEAQSLIADGRNKKAMIGAYEPFKKSVELSADLLSELHKLPTARNHYARAALTILGVLAGGVIATITVLKYLGWSPLR